MRLLVLVLLVPCSLCAPSTLPRLHISSLSSQVGSSLSTYTQVGSSLRQLGALAVTGLGHQYASAIHQLRHTRPECLTGAVVQTLTDGSYRTTVGTSTLEPLSFPSCVSDPTATIISTFDQVDSALSSVFPAILGNDGWKDPTTGQSGHMADLPTKTHLHVYHSANTTTLHPLSWPFHLDNGLYLLVTPSAEVPLMLESEDGKIVTSAGLPEDTVLLLVGRGLSEWMLQGREGAVRAVPHAVPSLRPSGVQTRAVVARMKVAPESAVPTTPGAGLTFGEIFNQLLPTRDTLTPSKAQLSWVKSHQGSCDAGYTYCWMGCRPVPEGCGDESLAVCTTQCGAQCCTDTITTNCQQHCGTAKCPTFKCPSDGLHEDPSSTCSDRFYNCAWGVAHEEFCDPGLVFNPYVKMCDWPDSGPMAGRCCWAE